MQGDYERASAHLAPDVVWEVEQELPAHGPAAVRRVWERWDSDWAQLETGYEELIDAGDHVVAAVRYKGRGRASGVEVDDLLFEVHSFRDGRCIRKVDFKERKEALEAAGLTPGPDLRVIERAVAAINRRDLAAYLACCTEDVELFTPVEVSGVYRGAEGIGRFFADVEDAAPDFNLQLERLEAVGPDRALGYLSTHATGRASGIPVEMETANVWDFEDGRIRRVRIFSDRSEAAKAARSP